MNTTTEEGRYSGDPCHRGREVREGLHQKMKSFPVFPVWNIFIFTPIPNPIPLWRSVIERCGILVCISHFGLGLSPPFHSVSFIPHEYCPRYAVGGENDKASPRTSSLGDSQEENSVTQRKMNQVP